MNTQRTIAHSWKALLSCVLALVVCLGITGCAKQDEEQIRSLITESFVLLKNPTEEGLAPYIEESNIDLSALDAYGIDFYEFLSHCFKNLDYSIDEIVIDDNEATATLTLTNTDLNAAAEAAANEITSNVDEYNEILSSENAEQELMAAFVKLLYEKIDESTETATNQSTLTFHKKDDTWEVDADSVMALMEGTYNTVEI